MARAYDLQIEKYPDEILVVFAQCRYSPAAMELRGRFRAEAADLAFVCAARFRLPPSCGRDDARQQALIALDLAIARYDTDELGKRNGCSFRTFVYKVVTAQLHNFVRDAWRQEKRIDRRVDASIAADDKIARRRRSAADDPAQALTAKEMLAALDQAVAELDADVQVLVKKVLTGMKPARAGRELGLSEDATRWRWQKAVTVLKKKMGKYWEE